METQAETSILQTVFTVGHSNRPIDDFLQLIAKFSIEVLVDVRSSPYSKFSPQFNQENLKHAVKNAGRKYLFLGREVGGKPKDAAFYDEEGYVLYWKLAASPLFEQGIERLRNGIASYTVALVCGEEDPSNCHRRLLVGKTLQKFGIEVLHIRGTGIVHSESDLELASGTGTKQMTIFSEPIENAPWRSAQSVLQRQPPSGSDR